MKRKLAILCILGLFLVVTAVGVDPGHIFFRPNETPLHTIEASLTDHDSIVITANADFAAQGWPGDGTVSNPYTIEELNIVDNASGISIANTTVYFEIRDCIVSSESQASTYGITFDNVTHGRLSGCTVEMHGDGIHLYYSSNCTLEDNTVTGNSDEGIHLIGSTNCVLVGNQVTENDRAFYLSGCGDCAITNNTMSDNRVAVSLKNSPHSQITNNEAINNDGGGFTLQNAAHTVLEDNYGTGNAGDYFLANSNNSTLINNTADSNSVSPGFQIGGSSRCKLLNNTAKGVNESGFHISGSDNCLLDGNTASMNSRAGFELTDCEDCLLCNNTANMNSVVGFELETCYACSLNNNTAIGNSAYGFYLDANRCALVNNMIADNSMYGAYLTALSEDNVLYLNYFVNNSPNAYDEGISNAWDNGTIGNYWSDYDGTGTYLVSGPADSTDGYPLVFETTTTPNPETVDPLYLIAGLGIIAGAAIIIAVFIKNRQISKET